MITPIKIILLIPLVLLVFLFVVQMRNRVVYRLSLVFIALVGIFFVLSPETSTALAHKLNVGRGTDLLLYLCAIAGFISATVIYSKLRRIEAVQTEIIQNMAIENARKQK